MAKAEDVAAAILDRLGPIDAFALQKLLYYAQAWHLAWYDRPLFDEQIEAWANGPVVQPVFKQHQGAYRVGSGPGDAEQMSQRERWALNAVLDRYGHLRGAQLSEMTHQEGPWQVTRMGLPPGAGSRKPIDRDLMRDYYRHYGDSRLTSVEAPNEVVQALAGGDADTLLAYLTSVEP